MWLEKHIPEDVIDSNWIALPESIRENNIQETRIELLNLFIDSLGIDYIDEEFSQQIAYWLQNRLRSEVSFLTHIDSGLIRDVIALQISELSQSINIQDRELFYKMYFLWEYQYVVISWIAINFSDILKSLFTLSHHNYLESYHLWVIDREQTWEFLEGDTWFHPDINSWLTLSQALEELGFSPPLREWINILFWRELDSNEIENLLLIIKITLALESSWWWNIRHNTWASTADWYFQYLTGNWRLVEEIRVLWRWDNEPWRTAANNPCPENAECRTRSYWHTNSYETALQALLRNEEILQLFPRFNNEIRKIEADVESQIVSELSTDEQIILFLWDMLRNWRNTIIEDFLKEPTKENFIRIYRLHHTDISDEQTARIMRERLPIFFDEE